jgi:hypothetical protein
MPYPQESQGSVPTGPDVASSPPSAAVESPPAPRASGQPRHSPLMVFVRYVLPTIGVLAGLVVMALGGESNLEGGAGIVGASLAIYAMNWLYRASVDGNRERDAEEAARDYFDAHGHWPDEAPNASTAPAPRAR